MKTVLQQWLWFAVLLILGMAHPVTAAPGDLDSTFNADGKVVTRVSTGDDLAWTMLMQDGGKILVVGEAANTGGTGVALVRYTGNGALDGDKDNSELVGCVTIGAARWIRPSARTEK